MEWTEVCRGFILPVFHSWLQIQVCMYRPQPLDHVDTQALEHLQREKGMNSAPSVLYKKVNKSFLSKEYSVSKSHCQPFTGSKFERQSWDCNLTEESNLVFMNRCHGGTLNPAFNIAVHQNMTLLFFSSISIFWNILMFLARCFLILLLAHRNSSENLKHSRGEDFA